MPPRITPRIAARIAYLAGLRGQAGGQVVSAPGASPGTVAQAQRLDQRLMGTSRAGVGPAPGGPVVMAHYVVVYGDMGGVFVYNGTPAYKNPPVISITNASTDPYGNTVYAGVVVYGANGSYVQMTDIQDIAGIVFGSGSSSEAQYSFLEAVAAADYIYFNIEGPEVQNYLDSAAIFIQSSYYDGSSYAGGNLFYTDRSGTEHFMLGWGYGGIQVQGEVGDSTFDIQNLSLCAVDSTQTTVTESGIYQLSRFYDIPANTATGGVIYRLEAWGYGTQGSTQQDLYMYMQAFGNDNNAENVMSSGTIAASASFWWNYRGLIRVVDTGTSGSAMITGTFTWSQQEATTTANAATAAFGENSFTINTTVDSSIGMTAGWAAATAGASITCTGSQLFREGGDPIG